MKDVFITTSGGGCGHTNNWYTTLNKFGYSGIQSSGSYQPVNAYFSLNLNAFREVYGNFNSVSGTIYRLSSTYCHHGLDLNIVRMTDEGSVEESIRLHEETQGNPGLSAGYVKAFSLELDDYSSISQITFHIWGLHYGNSVRNE